MKENLLPRKWNTMFHGLEILDSMPLHAAQQVSGNSSMISLFILDFSFPLCSPILLSSPSPCHASKLLQAVIWLFLSVLWSILFPPGHCQISNKNLQSFWWEGNLAAGGAQWWNCFSTSSTIYSRCFHSNVQVGLRRNESILESLNWIWMSCRRQTLTLDFSTPGNTRFFLVLVKQFSKIMANAKPCLFSYVVLSQQGKRRRMIYHV